MTVEQLRAEARVIPSRVVWVLVLALQAIGCPCPVLAQDQSALLYETAVIVTGQREETRTPGIRRCFLDVLQKVSGDQTIANDLAVVELSDRAGSFVTSYRYHDRLSKRPIHDEQGTRDRPYDLTVDFDRDKVNAALRSVGREPWTGPRPAVAVFVAVQQGASTYVTSTDGPNGYGQADAILDAAAKTGLSVAVPGQDLLGTGHITADALRRSDPVELAQAARDAGAEVPLVGTMTFSDEDLGWIVEWRFAWHSIDRRWQVRGVNFDAGFLDGLRGVAQILSGTASRIDDGAASPPESAGRGRLGQPGE